jgi:hypothetical protein
VADDRCGNHFIGIAAGAPQEPSGFGIVGIDTGLAADDDLVAAERVEPDRRAPADRAAPWRAPERLSVGSVEGGDESARRLILKKNQLVLVEER